MARRIADSMAPALTTPPERMLLLGITLLSAAACGSPPQPSSARVLPTSPGLSTADEAPLELEGELAGALTAGVSKHGVVLGGDMRGGNYVPLRRGIPVLLGNRVGYDFRLRILYGRGESDAFTGHFLLGFTPSMTQQLAERSRRSK